MWDATCTATGNSLFKVVVFVCLCRNPVVAHITIFIRRDIFLKPLPILQPTALGRNPPCVQRHRPHPIGGEVNVSLLAEHDAKECNVISATAPVCERFKFNKSEQQPSVCIIFRIKMLLVHQQQQHVQSIFMRTWQVTGDTTGKQANGVPSHRRGQQLRALT